jgi:hypothetical protein
MKRGEERRSYPCGPGPSAVELERSVRMSQSIAMLAGNLFDSMHAPRKQFWSRRVLHLLERKLSLRASGQIDRGRRFRSELGARFAYPTRQVGLRIVLHPLVEQRTDLAAQVGATVQPGKLETFKGRKCSVSKKVPWRVGAPGLHSAFPPNCALGNK